MSQLENVARTIWRSADAVCFDVDSTVCRDEAIDELAKFVGRDKEVSELTKAAMRGGCTFQDALAQRLRLIKPTVDVMKEYLRCHPPRLTPGIRELIQILKERGVSIYLVSGGFDTLIEPVAKELGIPVKNIFANSIKFFFDGSYAGFDETRPTSQQDGKARVISYLKQHFGYRRVIMVGDGATDLEAFPPADTFIGFGGNQIRPKIKQAAPWFVLSFYDLIEELNSN